MSRYQEWGQQQETVLTSWGGQSEAVTGAVIDVPTEIYDLFATLADQWVTDTAVQSSLTKRYAHPAYQRIVGIGPAVVPLLLNELETEPNYWFHALRAITGADPVTPQMRGNLREMTDAWLAWGRRQGYLIQQEYSV